MDKELLNKLPLFPINRHGKRLTEKQLEKLIELIAMEENAPKPSFPKRGKCACGGYFQDWHSHASECIVINKHGKDFSLPDDVRMVSLAFEDAKKENEGLEDW